MPFLFVEWQCPKCQLIHRIRFALKTDDSHPDKPNLWKKGKIQIYDPAFFRFNKISVGSHRLAAVYADAELAISHVTNTVKDYVEEFYTTERDTVKADVCFNEP